MAGYTAYLTRPYNYDGVTELGYYLQGEFDAFTLYLSHGHSQEVYRFPRGNSVFTGSGSPESAVVAPPGSLYLDEAGGAGTTLYVKESGTSNTGWVAK